jgi:hypothetical protein
MFRTNPGTWKLRVFWELTYAEMAQNGTKPPKISEIASFKGLDPPE